jgi:sugar O-acyltransferase (sialic acid O-acetyltransferase NeuD family)
MSVCGRPVLGSDSVLASIPNTDVELVNGIGSTGQPTLRQQVQSKLERKGWQFRGVRHASAIASRFSRIDVSAQCLAGSIVQCGAAVEAGCILNTGAIVEHDVRVGEWTHVAPRAVLCGEVRVGARCHIGAGAVIRQGVTLGNDSFVGAGAVVVANFAGGGLLMGVPARVQAQERDT